MSRHRRRISPSVLCVLLAPWLYQPALAAPSWQETIGWIEDKMVLPRPYKTKAHQREVRYRVGSVSGDGCHLVLVQEEQTIWKSGRTDFEYQKKTYPMKDYFGLKTGMLHSGAEYISILSSDNNITVEHKGGYRDGKTETYSDALVVFPSGLYPDFLKRLDNALTRLSALARSNPACGKKDLF